MGTGCAVPGKRGGSESGADTKCHAVRRLPAAVDGHDTDLDGARLGGQGRCAVNEPSATVLIPEAEPERLWPLLLQNQRGADVARPVRRETDAVICRLRFRLL